MTRSNHRTIAPFVFLAVCGFGLGVLACKRYGIIASLKKRFRRNALSHQKVAIISSPDQCRAVVSRLNTDLNKLRVLGFDCEWLTVDGLRRPVALLQLGSTSGCCALVRLSQLKHVPAALQEILEDETILKVGVAPLDDAKYLMKDYGVNMKGTLDLRHLANYLERPPEGLAKLAKAFLGVELNKNWRIRCSSWDSATLTEDQIDYAAKDCLSALEIYKTMAQLHRKQPANVKPFDQIAFSFVDRPFKYSGRSGIHFAGASSSKNKTPLTSQKRNMATRNKPLYDNCVMEAPDGDPLCTMDRSKAEWYCKKGLATKVCDDPIRMRLNFEPSGRAVGRSGLYDLLEKENRCVVCGTEDNFSRKSVIPREYRRFFPVVLKSHSSHDILLLCLDCHRTSHMEDNKLRDHLAVLCNAPLVCHFKKVKTYAQILLKKKHLLDEDAQNKMIDEIKDFFPNVTEHQLVELAELNTKLKAGDNCDHARIVTDYFKIPDNGGLLELERMWRKHFLDTMKPLYLPKHWSVVHNAERLETRAALVAHEDLLAAGLNVNRPRAN